MYEDMKYVPQNTYLVGSDKPKGFPFDKESPQTEVLIEGFYIDETTVTNEQFSKFVEETGYVTEAEIFGDSYVFHYFVDKENSQYEVIAGLDWWYVVKGANWKHPEGPNSNIKDRMNHPVVHISRNDALEYCKHTGKRLPTEIEWEIAAKGNTNNESYPWGDEFLINGQYNANIWQGNFPHENSADDGFTNTAPANYFTPNDYGLYQMIGNVWEWCLNPQGINLSEFKVNNTNYYIENYSKKDNDNYALKGGSFLCNDSYCNRYRISARNGNSASSTSNNMGFRCVKSK